MRRATWLPERFQAAAASMFGGGGGFAVAPLTLTSLAVVVKAPAAGRSPLTAGLVDGAPRGGDRAGQGVGLAC
jgi:hypothetical protein